MHSEHAFELASLQVVTYRMAGYSHLPKILPYPLLLLRTRHSYYNTIQCESNRIGFQYPPTRGIANGLQLVSLHVKKMTVSFRRLRHLIKW